MALCRLSGLTGLFHRFEEEYFVRLPRKRHARDSGRGARETADKLTDFSALRSLMRGEGGEVRGTEVLLLAVTGNLTCTGHAQCSVKRCNGNKKA